MSTQELSHDDGRTALGTVETIDGSARALSQIHTGADESTGNEVMLRSEKVYLPDKDRFENVPFITGNAVRGHIRRLLAEDLVERIGYTITDERLYYLLRSGGVLEKGGKSEIDVGLRREIREVLPTIDLLGGATGNQMFGGTVDIHHLTLVCAENNWRTDAQSETTYRQFTDTHEQSRMHDEPDDTGMDVDFGFDLDADGGDEGDDSPGTQQMRYGFEVIAPGAGFEHSVRFESYATELARACMCHGLRLWQNEGVVGGLSSEGLGRIDVEYDADLSAGDRYTEYIDEHGGDVIEALDTIADT